ncbi:MAG TPA: hypothetical protein VEY50_01405 [Lysobacter sp.]|nr:hypothetical protein [Lysobacter sp.]
MTRGHSIGEVGRLSLGLFAAAIGALSLLATLLFAWHAAVAGLPVGLFAPVGTATQARIWVFAVSGWSAAAALALLYLGCLAAAWAWSALRARARAGAGQ